MNHGDLEVVSERELLKRGRKLDDIVKERIALDYRTMRGLTRRDEGSMRQWVKVMHKSMDGSRMLLDSTGSIVGYWHSLALKDKYFDLQKRGLLEDSQIDAESIFPLTKKGIYKLYNMEIALKRALQDTGVVNLLYDSYFDAIEEFAKKGIFFSEVCANAYTKAGEAVCRRCGMEHVADNISRGRIYWMRFPDYLARNARGRIDLLNLYSKFMTK